MTEGRALTRLVVLDGQVWEAGSVPPPAVAARIRNPQAWAPIENRPGVNWWPEADMSQDWVIKEKPVKPVTRVPEPDPAPNGLKNLEPQPASTDSSAVMQPPPGTVTNTPAPEPAIDQPVLLSEPPRSGRGSSEAAWRAYAEQFNVIVPPDADRGQIIAQLKDDGYIQ